jgi:hypothetical protein
VGKNKPQHLLVTRVKLKMDQAPQRKANTMKLLEENI